MTKRSLNRQALAKALRRRGLATRREAPVLIESILAEIVECLGNRESLKLVAFGTFVVRKQGPRMGRNPKTRAPAPIPEALTIVFKPSRLLKDRLNE